MSVHKPASASKKRTRFGISLEQSAREILAHVNGEIRLPIRRFVLPDEVEARPKTG
jgi:hypothetical protein